MSETDVHSHTAPAVSRTGTPVRDALVTLREVGFAGAGGWLVRGVDFSVSRGEIVTLIGPNGSGKSTTAKTAIGVMKPDEGRVEKINGLKVGYVPQKLSIDWTLPLTVERLMTLTGPLKSAEIAEALSSTGILHLARGGRCSTCLAASSSGRFWRGPSPAGRTCWCWTSRCRASISPARSRSTT